MNNLSISEQPLQVQVVGKTFGIRALAYVIDSVVHLLITIVISFLSGFILAIVLKLIGREYRITDDQTIQCIYFIFALVKTTFYFIIFEWLYGATLGKLVFGMRVVKENGEPCNFGAAFKRALYRYIDGLFFGLPAYNSMRMPLYQRLGDESAKTIVVDAKSPIIQQPRTWWWFFIAAGLYFMMDVTITLFSLILSLR